MDTTSRTKVRQREQLLQLLKLSLNWVPIFEVVAVAGFQFEAQVFKLLSLGYRIENKPGGSRLVASPAPAVSQPQPIVVHDSPANADSFFGGLTPAPRYAD